MLESQWNDTLLSWPATAPCRWMGTCSAFNYRIHSCRAWYLLSVERPAVAMREEEPTKTKSWAVLLWHCSVWRDRKETVSGADSNREAERSKQKWDWQHRGGGERKSGWTWKWRSRNLLERHEAVTVLPSRAWAPCRWCWSARGSTLRLRPRCRTTRKQAREQMSDARSHQEKTMRDGQKHTVGRSLLCVCVSLLRGCSPPHKSKQLLYNYWRVKCCTCLLPSIFFFL